MKVVVATCFSVAVSGEVSYSGGTVASDVNYTLSVSVSDASGASALATVSVLVLRKDSAPVFDSSSYAFTVSDSGIVGTVVASDANGDTLNYSIESGGSSVFSVEGSGGISYSGGTVASDVNYTLSVSVTDSTGLRASATVSVLVEANAAPLFSEANYAFTVSDNNGVVGTVMASDADGDVLSYGIESGGGNVFSVAGSGEVSYSGGTVASDVNYTLLVRATDGLGLSDLAMVSVLVRSTAVIY